MKLTPALLLLALIFISCEPTRKAAPPLPPGVERGQTWEKAESYGYEEDIYITPDYITYPLKGSRNLRLALHKSYRNDLCDNGPSRLIVRYVVSKDGNILGVHPMENINPGCMDLLTEAFNRFKFYPAEYNGEAVHMLMAITISDRRI